MVVTVEEMKNYLRVDFEDDDVLLSRMIGEAQRICMDVARMDDAAEFEREPAARIAVMYAAAYFYEQREEADHHALVIGLRVLLSGIRKEGF